MATRRVLVVDPDVDISNLAVLILEEEGYQVTTCLSLSEAAELLSKSHFDLVITEAFNQKHPFDFDPTYLTTIMQAAPSTPVILFSVYADIGFPHPGRFGLADVVPKVQFDIHDLARKVRRVLEEEEKSHGGPK